MQSRCEVCKRELPEDNVGTLCRRVRCHDIHTHLSELNNRINYYTEFFSTHAPTDENYKEYLVAAELEEKYQAFVKASEDPDEPISRRVWFQLNVAHPHQASDWRDEFCRKFEG